MIVLLSLQRLSSIDFKKGVCQGKFLFYFQLKKQSIKIAFGLLID